MLYSVVLFLHVGAALVLASALSIDALLMFQVRRATSPNGTKSWLDLWSAVSWMAGGSGFVLLLSGGYLADRMSAWTLAWPKVALATLILIGALGATTSKRMRALRRANALDQAEFFRQLDNPLLKISLSIRIALVFAAVLLMNAKPQLRESLGIVGGFVLIGLAAAFVLPNRPTALSRLSPGDGRLGT
jgi:hypothetical protein